MSEKLLKNYLKYSWSKWNSCKTLNTGNIENTWKILTTRSNPCRLTFSHSSQPHKSSVAVTSKGTHYRCSSPAVTMNNQTCCLGAEKKRRKREEEKEGKKRVIWGGAPAAGGEASARSVSSLTWKPSAFVLPSSSAAPRPRLPLMLLLLLLFFLF